MNPIYLISKWIYCSWAHKEHRCYPAVNRVNSKSWHCDKCHPCNEGMDDMLKTFGDGWHFEFELSLKHLWIGGYWEVWEGEERNRLDCYVGGPLLVLRIIRVWEPK